MSTRCLAATSVVVMLMTAGSAGAHDVTVAPSASSMLLAHPSSLRGFPTAPVPTASASPPTTRQATPDGVRFGPRHAVERLPCRPGDTPETDLQGRVPPLDIASGRAALGYRCNLELVGRYPSGSAGTLDSYGTCAYYGLGTDVTGVQVLDVSDPRLPKPTTVLTTPAMLSPWESLKVNAKRKLLVADRWSASPDVDAVNSTLDIYDISGDCRHPRLVSSTRLPPARGHEGWFAPDGMTYFMSKTGPDGQPSVFPVDISDPAKPKVLASWTFPSQTHGGSTTEDGSRSYICQQNDPPRDQLLVVDTSEITTHRSDPEAHLLAQIPLQDNQWCQAAYRVTYGGRPFLIQYGERSGAADCSRVKDNWASFGYPRIYDIADERHPKLISSALLEVDLPEHCAQVTGEGAINGLGYSVHHCSPDRLYDPTILACDYFGAGMRVLDIRNPYKPVEIGYFNPGTTAIVGTGARPVVLTDRGEIWFTNDVQGFFVVRFEDGVWPFKTAARCPEFDDFYFAHYNLGSTCPTANSHGIGRPAPGRAGSVPDLQLTRRRLHGHRLRLAVSGASSAAVREVRFSVGAKRVAVDRHAPFACITRIRAGAGTLRLKALVVLADGRRVTLRRVLTPRRG